MPNMPTGEIALINWIRQRAPAHGRVLVGPGDDAAIIAPPQHPLLITTDMLLEGSCFLLDQAGARRVGRKAMGVNLSDIAAMAGVPTAAVVSFGLPRDGGREIAEQLYEGIREVADAFDCPIVGGDTNTWNGALVICGTVIGEATAHGAVCRRNATPGDWIFVTGPVGGSILGKHLDFTPRVREALELVRRVEVHAMIDISDGLSLDLHRICEESGCGAVLYAERIPIAPAAHELAASDNRPPLDHALTDGEDFELLFTVAPDAGEGLLRRQPIADIQLAHIGVIVESGLWIEEAGARRALTPRGYEHAFCQNGASRAKAVL